MPVLFKNQSVLLKDFFNQQEDEPLKGISHKNILIKKNIIAYMALNGESTLADLAREPAHQRSDHHQARGEPRRGEYRSG